jgi:hypothetical protein
MKSYIICSYRNRLNQFLYTLKTIDYHYMKNERDTHVVVVDDGSDSEYRLEDVIMRFNFKITLLRLDEKYKTWLNPCVTYNIAMNTIQDAHDDDVVILQNPECCHKDGDLIQHAMKYITHENYHVYNCFAFNEEATQRVFQGETFNSDELMKQQLGMWYEHPIHLPRFYHFCAALSYKNLKRLNGFDNRFAQGHAYDDDEFTYRVAKLGLNRYHINSPMVYHLHHTPYPSIQPQNHDLFNSIKQLSESYHANIGTSFGVSDNTICGLNLDNLKTVKNYK